ncbi:hypothetical protein [Frateuria sp. STR12]|uniref:hypothetical protein n=1 Tax=Frateuria hangzhouensis TaxID=2995589 RepID=UPI002260A3A7|nr:hypothetical protein [Frateuria sp. STR12]MCX7514987.1 hypothetical protein [Frateuria sp. STR12]
MGTTTKSKRAAKWALATVVAIGLVLPLIIALLVSFTADTTMRVGDVGSFVSSTTSAGGLFARPATTVQTSVGSLVVSGRLSAVKGQRLAVEDRLKSGLHLCVQTTPPTCVDVEGPWTGDMKPVRNQWQVFGWLAARVSVAAAGLWFVLGLISTMVAASLLASAGGWAGVEDAR